jgi:hypothetical protein
MATMTADSQRDRSLLYYLSSDDTFPNNDMILCQGQGEESLFSTRVLDQGSFRDWALSWIEIQVFFNGNYILEL